MEKEKNNLHLKSLSLTYRQWRAGEDSPVLNVVHGVTQTFSPGNCYGIVGYTGCGKSTLLREIAGLNDRTILMKTGEVSMPESWIVSSVFQQPFTTFNPLLSVRAHLRESYGKTQLNREEREKINSLLLRYKLWEYGDQKLDERSDAFSIGQLQRFLWVMALVRVPDLLLLDEPFAHVDADTVALFQEDLKDLKKKGKIIIIASHLRKLIYRTCDETYLMTNGVLDVYVEGTPSSISKAQPRSRNEGGVPILHIKNLSYNRVKKREEIPILRNLNFSIERGELVGIYGDSGAGKSTLGRIIAGRIHDYKGDIFLSGNEIRGKKRLTRAEVVQFLPQDPVNLFPPDKNVEELVSDLVKLHRIEDEYREYVGNILPQIKFIYDKEIVSLSGGQRQLLLFYQAILINPRVLIIDENFSAMDPHLVSSVGTAVHRWLQEYDSGGLLISHHIDELTQMSHRVYSLENLQSL